MCFSRRPLLYSIRFSSSFLRLVEKYRRNRPPQKSERSKTSSRARCDSKRVRFFVVKAQNKGASSSFTKKKCARTGFGVIVVIATDATSAAFVKTSRRSTSSTLTVLLRSSFSCCCFRVDFKDDAHTKGCGRLEEDGWWCLLVNEKRLVVVVLLMLVAANMCRVRVCVWLFRRLLLKLSLLALGKQKKNSLSSFSDTLN